MLWAKSAGGTSIEGAQGISTDETGNVLITGYFASTSITFGTTTLTNAMGIDIFVVKYDALGNVLWAKSAGGISSDFGVSIANDVSGNIFVTGFFNSPSINFGTTTLINKGESDVFVVKYDEKGNVMWVKSSGGVIVTLGKVF